MITPELYKFLIDHSKEIICYHEAIGRYIFVSASIKHYTGYDQDELTGKNPYDFIHPDDCALFERKAHLPVLAGHETSAVEYRFRKKDDTYMWLQSFTQPIKGEHGTIEKFISTSRDITDLIHDKHHLERESLLLGTAAKMTRLGVWELDLDCMRPEWSAMACSIFETAPGEVTEHEQSLAFYMNGSRDKIAHALHEAAEKGISFDLTVPVLTAKSNKKWVRVTGKPELSFGRVSRICGSFQDLTDITENNVRLNNMVDYLTQQMKHVEDFNQIVSHNLRSPVLNLGVLVDCLENAKDEAEKESYIRYIKKVSESLQGTLNDLVDVVKVIQHKDIPKENLSMREMLDKVTSSLQGQVLNQNAIITLDNDAWDVIAYPPVYLESILLNLISNALKYASPARDPEIRLTASYHDGMQVLEVADNGSGIDLKKHGEKVFKLHQTFHSETPGKGLGLFMTKNQIEALGGEISVEGQPDVGTTFRITFNKFIHI